MDPLYISLAALALAAVSVGVTLSRKRNHVVEGLRAELDLALAENARLVKESQALADELHSAKVKAAGPEKLREHARLGVEHAEQMGGTGRQKLVHALAASIQSDRGANGVQDWTDAQHRVAIEAELAARRDRKAPSAG